jgi:cytochrome c553
MTGEDRRMERASLMAFVLGLVLTTTPAFAVDDEESDDANDEIESAYEKKLRACAVCHGEKTGDKPIAPNYPVLFGQYADYLEEALKAYRSGRRQDPVMGQQLEILALTDEEIAKIAAYYGAQSGLEVLGD